MLRNLMKRIHLATQAKQMNRNHCADLFSILGFPCAIRIRLAIFLEALLNHGWPNVVSFWIDVGKKWPRPDARDAPGGREKCVWCRDNGIATFDSKRHQNSQQSIGSRRNTNRVWRIAVCAHRLLERLYFWSKDETAARQNVVRGLAN